jgi:carboxylesterase type B
VSVVLLCSFSAGPFGFVALREDQQAGKPTGNHALTDMQAALTFLRAHIGSFGGDPSRLTMFGQSSGAGLVLLHTVIPSSASLFEGVVGQSNGLSADSFNYSLATTATLAKALNCTTRGYKTTKACLLAATDDELTYAQGVVRTPARAALFARSHPRALATTRARDRSTHRAIHPARHPLRPPRRTPASDRTPAPVLRERHVSPPHSAYLSLPADGCLPHPRRSASCLPADSCSSHPRRSA